MLTSKRNDFTIALQILRLVRAGERKTRIMYGANLSYEMLNRYLGSLEDLGFLTRDEAARTYAITDRGRALVADLERVHHHFPDGDGGHSPPLDARAPALSEGRG